MIVVSNNSVIDIDASKHETTLFAPSSNESLLETTNNNFSRITEIVSYSWEKSSINHVNLVAVHRSKPLVAYVINTGYHKNHSAGRAIPGNPLEQVIRLVNHDTSSRALCKPMMRSAIVDIAFSYDTSDLETNKVAIIDKEASIAILEYKELPPMTVDKGSIKFEKVLTILPPTNIGLSPYMKLSWCPYIPGDDDEDDQSAALRLAVSIGRSVEVFTFSSVHFKVDNVPLDRCQFRKDLGQYLVLEGIHESPIVSIAMSNDGTAICTGSVDNKMVFNQITFIGNMNNPNSGVGEPEIKQLKQWSPNFDTSTTNAGGSVSAEMLSSFYFLDDYEYLLNHPDQSFWGNVFIGSKNGILKIFDLKDPKWKCIQTIKLVTEDANATSGHLMDADLDPDTGFNYHVDSSSKVILAIRRNLVFVLLIDVTNRSGHHHHRGSSITDASGDDNILVPRIRQVARFQLYNQVISFRVKKSSDNEIDVFWMTLKTLQKCTIFVDKLDMMKEINPQIISVPIKSVAPTLVPQPVFGAASNVVNQKSTSASSMFETSQVFGVPFPSSNDLMSNIATASGSTPDAKGSALEKLMNLAKKNEAHRQARNVSNVAASVVNDHEAELMAKLRAKDEELKKRKSDAGHGLHGVNFGTDNTNVASASASVSSLLPGLGSMSMTPSAPSASASVMVTPNKLNNQTASLKNQLNITGSTVKSTPGSRPLPVGTQVVNPTNLGAPGTSVLPPGVPMINPPLGLPTSLNETARAMLLDDRFRDLERNFNQQFKDLNSKLSTAFTGLQSEVASLRSMVQEGSASEANRKDVIDKSLISAVIDKTVEKSMKQLNLILSNGLKEFFDQVDVGVSELQVSVSKSIKDVETMYQSTNQQMSDMQRQLAIFQTQLEKNEAEQQLLLYRFNQAAANVSNVGSGGHGQSPPSASGGGSAFGNLGSLFR